MSVYCQSDLEKIVEQYQQSNQAIDRYASFDYCYEYFCNSSSEEILADKEKSCLVLGFYLASWGMLRGSSFTLSKSIKYYEPLINYIAEVDRNLWHIDVDCYNEDSINLLCKTYSQIKAVFVPKGSAHLTLVTKIMLGIFGCVPAFDSLFANTFRTIFDDCGFRRFNAKSLLCVKQFYETNKVAIDGLANQITVRKFHADEESGLTYTKAKIIDMYGFFKGQA